MIRFQVFNSMRIIKYFKKLFNGGSSPRERMLREIENAPSAQINITFQTIRDLRNRLLPFQIDVGDKTLQEHRAHFDALAADLIDLDLPTWFTQMIVEDLEEANGFFNLLTDQDLEDFEDDLRKRNEVYGILSGVARRLSRTLVALQKEIGVL